MFSTIVLGTDGSDTAKKAVSEASELAKVLGASVCLVSAYEPVSNQRLREESRDVPKDMQWTVNPKEDVEATLEEAAEEMKGAGSRSRPSRARATPPTRSSTWRRRRAPT